MRIRYSKNDPRAGMIVDLEEGAARSKIDAGEAEEVTGKTGETDADRKAAETGLGYNAAEMQKAATPEPRKTKAASTDSAAAKKTTGN